MERVGHTYIKKRMAETNSFFGGEVSGHYYLSANAYMENSFAIALVMTEIISKSGKKLSQIIRDLGDYHVSGEINFKVPDVKKVLDNIQSKFLDAKEILKIDGLSFEFDEWRFNVRPSANDPVLRLCLEAKNEELMKEKVEEISAIIKDTVTTSI